MNFKASSHILGKEDESQSRKEAYLHGVCTHVFERERLKEESKEAEAGEGGVECIYVGQIEKRKGNKSRKTDALCEKNTGSLKLIFSLCLIVLHLILAV